MSNVLVKTIDLLIKPTHKKPLPKNDKGLYLFKRFAQ